MTIDRRKWLLGRADVDGIDYVEIANSAQTVLNVHLFNGVLTAGDLARPKIYGGDTIAEVPISSVAVSGHVITITVPFRGDFSLYTLELCPSDPTASKLDPFFRFASFSFKARCDTLLDCKPKPAECPDEQANLPPIDYLAKDFLSFKKALLDFSALRYPGWKEKSEADFGVMM